MDRADVYKLIDGEREYQSNLGPERTDYAPKSVGDYLVMLDHYVKRAKEEWTNNAGTGQALERVRKCAGICVRCMEDHETPARENQN